MHKSAHVPTLTEATLWQLIRSTVLRPRKPSRQSAAISISPNVTELPQDENDKVRGDGDPRQWSWDGDDGWKRLKVVAACLWQPAAVWAALTGSGTQKRLPSKAERIAAILISDPTLMGLPYKDLKAILRESHRIASVDDKTVRLARRRAAQRLPGE